MRLLLITSRETKRWVLPKGNPIRGLDPHLAAAAEAYEEAGVTGFVCPSPIGNYRYDKRRRNGSITNAVVDVYPLAFINQLETWPEAHQRTTQWFTLPEAAAAVDETELKAIISGFRQPEPQPSRSARAVETVRRHLNERIPPLQWFQALMPKTGRFFEHFESHALTLVAGADALAKLLQGGDSMAANALMIHDLENQADDIARAVLHDVRRTFVTPFDRSAITSLIGSMDDAIDQMNATAKSIMLFEVTDIDPAKRDMAALIVEAARVTAEAIPLLRAIGPNSARLHELTERLIKIEGDADDIHDAGVKALFKAQRKAAGSSKSADASRPSKSAGDAGKHSMSAGDTSTMEFIVRREIYSHLERVLDRFEDVANEIQGLVIDHA